jgi:hypothetical protein
LLLESTQFAITEPLSPDTLETLLHGNRGAKGAGMQWSSDAILRVYFAASGVN